MKQPPDTNYTVCVLGNTETHISQLELINLLFAIEASLHLEQLYLRYKQEKPLQIYKATQIKIFPNILSTYTHPV